MIKHTAHSLTKFYQILLTLVVFYQGFHFPHWGQSLLRVPIWLNISFKFWIKIPCLCLFDVPIWNILGLWLVYRSNVVYSRLVERNWWQDDSPPLKLDYIAPHIDIWLGYVNYFGQWNRRKIKLKKYKAFCSPQIRKWFSGRKKRKDKGKIVKRGHRGKRKEMATWSKRNEVGPASSPPTPCISQSWGPTRSQLRTLGLTLMSPVYSLYSRATLIFLPAATKWRLSLAVISMAPIYSISRYDTHLSPMSLLWPSLTCIMWLISQLQHDTHVHHSQHSKIPWDSSDLHGGAKW